MAESTSSSKSKATKVPEGHRRVRWLFNPRDKGLVGSVVDMRADEAQNLAAGNRVTYVDESTPLGKAAPEGEPAPAPLADTSADTSGGRDTGSATANPVKSR